MEDGNIVRSSEIESLAKAIATNEKNRDAQIAAMEKRHDQGRDAILEIIKIMHEGHMESVKALTERVNALGEKVNALGDEIKNLRVDMRDMEKRLMTHVELTVEVQRQETKVMEKEIRGELKLMKLSIRMFWIPAVTLLTLVGAVAIRTFGPDILIWLDGMGIAP